MKSVRCAAAAVAIATAALALPAGASAAQLVVDDDRADCPSAGYTSIAAAVTAAAAGDTVSVCDGDYVEGAGTPGSTAITIDKPLTLRGAGAGRTFVRPAGGSGGQIAAATPNLRDAAGNIISVVGTTARISGLTVVGVDVFVEAGIGYVDADGVVASVEIADLVQAESTQGDGRYGRSETGVGFVATGPDPAALNNVTLEDSVIEGHNAAGVIVDAAQADGSPQPPIPSPPNGVFALLNGNRITGAGRATAATTQDGIRILNGATAVAVENQVADNVRSGIRYENSRPTSQTRFNLNNVQGNGFGLFHAPATGSAVFRVDAQQNWWGSPAGPTTDGGPPAGDAVTGAREAVVDPATGVLFARTPAVDFRNLLTRPAPVPTPLRALVDAAPTVALTAPAGGAAVPVGQAVAITATASDDVGVKAVTFRRGTTVLAVDSTAPYTAEYTPSAADAGTNQAITATAEDNRGQTAAAAVSVRVIGPDDAPEDAPPAVTITEPAADPRSATFALAANATDDRGIAKVTFYLGGRVVCTDVSAPYRCTVEATGDDVGRTSLVAIATDSAGQTATAIQRLRVPRIRPEGLTARTRQVGDSRTVVTTGRLRRPDGVSRRDACEGEVAVTYKRDGRTIAVAETELESDCTYRVREQVRFGQIRVRARFYGNDVLTAVSSAARTVRVR